MPDNNGLPRDTDREMAPYQTAIDSVTGGRFRLVKFLGIGQTAIVWKAEDLRPGRPDAAKWAAIKILMTKWAASPAVDKEDRVKTLHRSYQCLRELQSLSYVVKLADVPEDDARKWLDFGNKYVFIALELLESNDSAFGNKDDNYDAGSRRNFRLLADHLRRPRYISLLDIMAVCEAWSDLMYNAHANCTPPFLYHDHHWRQTFLDSTNRAVKIIDFNEAREYHSAADSYSDVQLFCTNILHVMATNSHSSRKRAEECLYPPLKEAMQKGMAGGLSAAAFRDVIAAAGKQLEGFRSVLERLESGWRHYLDDPVNNKPLANTPEEGSHLRLLSDEHARIIESRCQ